MDILETGVDAEFEEYSAALSKYNLHLASMRRFRAVLNEQAAKLSAREKALDARHAEQMAAADMLQDRETAVSGREKAASSLKDLLSQRAAVIKTRDDRIAFLDDKIDKLQKEKGSANERANALQEKNTELQKTIRALKEAIAEPTPAIPAEPNEAVRVEQLADVAQA